MQQRPLKDEADPAKAVREEFYPKGRKGGVVIRIQADFTNSGQVFRYALSLIDVHVGIDNGRIVGYDNSHGYHHRHCRGAIESVEFESYESIEKRFEAEVRRYLETGEI